MRSAAERYERWSIKNEFGDDAEGEAGRDWAERGDGALMILDEEGWFYLVTTTEGPTYPGQSHIYAQNPDGPLENIYCEPMWISWAKDAMYEKYHDHSVGDVKAFIFQLMRDRVTAGLTSQPEADQLVKHALDLMAGPRYQWFDDYIKGMFWNEWRD
jgi:hypothetical protein